METFPLRQLVVGDAEDVFGAATYRVMVSARAYVLATARVHVQGGPRSGPQGEAVRVLTIIAVHAHHTVSIESMLRKLPQIGIVVEPPTA